MVSKWLPKAIDIFSVLILIAIGIFLAGTAIIFSDYGGPPTPEEQAETYRLFAFGASLCIAGALVPLRNKKRALIAFAMITTTAMLVLFLDGGQQDVESVYILLLILGVPLYFLRRHSTRKT